MSTLVVVRKEEEICIASETLTTFGSTKFSEKYNRYSNKIFKWGENFIGLIGYSVHNMVLESLILNTKEVPILHSKTDIFEFFRQLHPKLKQEYFLKPFEDEDDPYESSRMEVIIANPSGIYGVLSLREVHEYTRFWAFGSGRRYALGAMYALYEKEGFAARVIAEAGVKAGIEFDDGSSGEVQFQDLKLDPKFK